MDIVLLGPVEAWAEGAPVPLGPPRQRAVFAALAADANRVVPAEHLLSRVWGAEPPEHGRRTLHTHVARIRRALREAGAGDEQLASRTGGYALQLDPERVDVHRRRQLLGGAREPGCPPPDRLLLLREAVRLPRGEPLADMAGEWAERTRVSWEQEHLDAVIAWACAEVEAGDPAAAVGPLSELADGHPLSEPLAGALMRVLVALGRPGEALSRFAGIQQRLVDELGSDPSRQLRDLHQAILRGDLLSGPDRVAAAGSAAGFAAGPEPAPAVVPAQLPAEGYRFTGREPELARLDALLAAGAGPAVAISGMAGAGKTALAVHWARRVADRFPDGQLYVDLRGFHHDRRVVEPTEALRGFLHALGVSAERAPRGVDAQSALLRSLLHHKRMLLVLDNARDAEHVRPLLPGTPTSLAVVTSRCQLTALAATTGAHQLSLGLMPAADAHELLCRRLGPDRLAAEPAAAASIIAACAGLPLALSITAARAEQSGFGLAQVAGELADTRGRLRVLDAGDPASQVRAVFTWSYEALKPPAAELFGLLGLHPGPDFTADAVARLADLPPARARALLTELARASLVTEHAPGRYALHDLLAVYAADLLASWDADTRAATGRLLDHYVAAAYAGNRATYPTRDPIPVPPAATAEAYGTDRLVAERAVLLAAQRHAAGAGFHRQAWQLAWCLDTFLYRRGHWHDWAAVWQVAATAAEHLPPAVAAFAHRTVAVASTRLGRYACAEEHLRRALSLAEAADPASQAYGQLALAFLRNVQQRPDAALEHAERALVLFRAAADRNGLAIALNSAGWYQTRLGDHHAAIASCRQALVIHQCHGNRSRSAYTWDSLGYAHAQLGEHAAAIDCFQRSAAILGVLEDRYERAATLVRLGEAHDAAGDAAAAAVVLRQALDILTELDHPDTRRVRARLAGLGNPG